MAGPPCGGKSTCVAQHATPADVVLDFDDIIERITGDRHSRDATAIAQARTEWSARLPTADWVIWTAPRRAQRGRFRSQWHATILVVTATLEECLRRAAETRPASWTPLVHQWFTEWEPSRSGAEQIIDTTNGTHH